MLLCTCNRVELYAARAVHGHPREEQMLAFLAAQRNVNVDVLPIYVGQRARWWLALLAIAISLAFVLTMAVLTTQFWLEAWENNWRSESMWRARLWIPYGAMPIGLGVLTLQYIVDLINLLTGREPPFGLDPDSHAVSIKEAGI